MHTVTVNLNYMYVGRPMSILTFFSFLGQNSLSYRFPIQFFFLLQILLLLFFVVDAIFF